MNSLLLLACLAQTDQPWRWPRYPEDWHTNGVGIGKGMGPEGRHFFVCEPANNRNQSRLSAILSSFPTDRKITIDIWLRGGEEGQWVWVKTLARKRGSDTARPEPIHLQTQLGEGYVSTDYARVTTDWKQYRKSIVAPASAREIYIEVRNFGSKPLEIGGVKYTVAPPP